MIAYTDKQKAQDFSTKADTWQALNSFIDAYSSSSSLTEALPQTADSSLSPGGIDFRKIEYLTQPMGSFSGLNFSPVAMSSSSLEGLDLDKELEGIKRMASSGIVPSPSRNKEYVSACILKGRLEDKADEFVLTMQDVFQLQAEEGIESAAEEREALVMADTRSYVLPAGERLASSNSHSLN